jgi:hypothetical protein
LSSVELPGTDKQCAGVPVGVSWWKDQESWNSSTLQQSEGSTWRTPQQIIGAYGHQKFWKRSDGGTTGYMGGATLRDSINSVTPVQYTKVPKPWPRASWISITVGYYSAGSPRPLTRWGSTTTAYNYAGLQEGDQVWLYCPIRTRRTLLKLQLSREAPYKVVTSTANVVYTIQCHPIGATSDK